MRTRYEMLGILIESLFPIQIILYLFYFLFEIYLPWGTIQLSKTNNCFPIVPAKRKKEKNYIKPTNFQI